VSVPLLGSNLAGARDSWAVRAVVSVSVPHDAGSKRCTTGEYNPNRRPRHSQAGGGSLCGAAA